MLFEERSHRLQTAVRLGTPDRVPLALVLDAFAAQVMGVKLSDFASDVELAGQTMLDAMELLGDVDSIQFAPYAPAMLGMAWLSPVELPGRQLPENTLWQVDEQVRIVPEDYDRIVEEGWSAWLGAYIGRYLGEAAAAGQAMMGAMPHWVSEFRKRGYVMFSPGFCGNPFENLCGGRTVKEFILDLYRIPDKVQAALDVIMAEERERTRQMVRAGGPSGYWVGGWRSAPEFLAPKLWNRFVWPYLQEMVETVVEEGGIPVLHFDANWDRELPRLKELPKARCVLALDGKTDIFRAKEVLDGHMCILGDVSPAMLSLATPDEVHAYCTRLINEIGPSGFILAQGCTIPFGAKLENVRAMVDAVK